MTDVADTLDTLTDVKLLWSSAVLIKYKSRFSETFFSVLFSYNMRNLVTRLPLLKEPKPRTA